MSAAACAKKILDGTYALGQAVGCMNNSILLSTPQVTEDMEKEFLESAATTATIAQKIARELTPAEDAKERKL